MSDRSSALLRARLDEVGYEGRNESLSEEEIMDLYDMAMSSLDEVMWLLDDLFDRHYDADLWDEYYGAEP